MKKAEITLDSLSESDMELEKNEPPAKTKAFHSIEKIRNYLTSIFLEQQLLITIHCTILKKE